MTTSPRSALERLTRWRDVGDGPIGYTAGNEAFAADVSALLSTVEQMREALKPFAHLSKTEPKKSGVIFSTYGGPHHDASLTWADIHRAGDCLPTTEADNAR